MKPATQEMKDQFVAKFATIAKPRNWNHDNFQLLVGLSADEFDAELAKLFNGWQPPVPAQEMSVIQISTLPFPKFPDWSSGRILTGGVIEPKVLDLTKLSADAWFHPSQTGIQSRPTGHEVLATLVKSYTVGKDKAGNTYQVDPATDLIKGHFGLRELACLEQNWKILPKAFRDWAKGKLLYGWADVVRDDDGLLGVPCLDCRVEAPYVDWYGLDYRWRDDEPALRE